MKIRHLQMQLIDKNRYQEFYEKMPDKCKEIADLNDNNFGIGLSHTIGWFVLKLDAFTSLFWSESLTEIN